MHVTLNVPQPSGWRPIRTADRGQLPQPPCTCWGVFAGVPQRSRCRRGPPPPRAAPAAERPGGEASARSKLPPLRRIRSVAPAADADASQPPVDVDRELWEVLELCSIEELEELHDILFGEITPICMRCIPRWRKGVKKPGGCMARSHAHTLWCARPVAGASPLSPVVKSIVMDSEPAAAHLRGRVGLMRRIESRFRFLAVRALDLLYHGRPVGSNHTLPECIGALLALSTAVQMSCCAMMFHVMCSRRMRHRYCRANDHPTASHC